MHLTAGELTIVSTAAGLAGTALGVGLTFLAGRAKDIRDRVHTKQAEVYQEILTSFAALRSMRVKARLLDNFGPLMVDDVKDLKDQEQANHRAEALLQIYGSERVSEIFKLCITRHLEWEIARRLAAQVEATLELASPEQLPVQEAQLEGLKGVMNMRGSEADDAHDQLAREIHEAVRRSPK